MCGMASGHGSRSGLGIDFRAAVARCGSNVENPDISRLGPAGVPESVENPTVVRSIFTSPCMARCPRHQAMWLSTARGRTYFLPGLVDLLPEVRVSSHFLLHLADRVDHGRVITATEDLADPHQ